MTWPLFFILSSCEGKKGGESRGGVKNLVNFDFSYLHFSLLFSSLNLGLDLHLFFIILKKENEIHKCNY